MSTTSAPTKTLTYEQALKAGRKVGASHADDPALMALLCEDTIQTLVGAVAPQLVWEGAQKVGLTSKELLALCNSNPIAVGELMWVENAEDFTAVLAHLSSATS